LLRFGELTRVWVPSELEEAARDLVRAREDARADLMRARHRLSKLLLRHGLLWRRSAWTREHDRWLAGLRFEGVLAVCFDESYGGVLDAKARRDRLDGAIAELAAAGPYADVVGRLCSLRGVSTLTALGSRSSSGLRTGSRSPSSATTTCGSSTSRRGRSGASLGSRTIRTGRPTAAGETLSGGVALRCA
jgi:transposase